MSYISPMDKMLEAFGAREKYEKVINIENWEEQMKACGEYERELMQFAVDFEQTLSPKDKKTLVYYSLRDRLMMIKGQQTVCHTYRGLAGTYDLEKLQKEAVEASNRYCLPFDIYVYA